MVETVELLFFDTFSHENHEELNLDLVQFRQPVCLTEIRVIPLGAKVQADFPGRVRLGATNPSQFQLEFFVNDLSKPGTSTFENLVSFEYHQNANIQMICENKIPTDGLVLRGWYTTITLALYGIVTNMASIKDIKDTPIAPSEITTSEMTTSPVLPDRTKMNEVSKDFNSSRRNLKEKELNDPLKHDRKEWKRKCITSNDKILHNNDSVNSVIAKCDRISPQTNHSKDRSTYLDNDLEKLSYKSAGDKKIIPIVDNIKQLSETIEPSNKETFKIMSKKFYLREHTKCDNFQSDSEFLKENIRKDSSKNQKRSDKYIIEIKEKKMPNIASFKVILNQEENKGPTFQPLSPGDIEAISDEEIPEEIYNENHRLEEQIIHASEEKLNVLEEYEEILSDEELMDDEQQPNIEMEFDFNEDWDEFWKPFNPYVVDLQPLTFFVDPSLTIFEKETRKLVRYDPSYDMIEAATHLLDISQQFSTPEVSDRWVKAVESVLAIIPQALAHILHQAQSAEIVNVLLKWTEIGLDFDKALQQPLPAFKTRHIKIGIRLVQSLCNCSTEVMRHLLLLDVQNKLLELYNQQFVALSLKLMILKALDLTTRSKIGMDLFIGITSLYLIKEDLDSPEHLSDNSTPSIYCKLIKMLLEPQQTRAKVAICALIKKAHLYEILSNMNQNLDDVMEQYQTVHNEKEDIYFLNKVSENVEELELFINEILRTYRHADLLLGQPPRAVPLKTQFELSQSGCEAYLSLFNYFQSWHLMECLAVILSCPLTRGNAVLISAVYELLLEFLQTQQGLLFLYSCIESVSTIIRIFLQEGSEESLSHQLGLQMVYYLQAVSQIDSLLEFHYNQSKSNDESDAMTFLNNLYSMTFSPMGKLCVVHVLSLEKNLLSILQFLETSYAEDTESWSRKSACRGYAIELLLMIVHYSESILYLEIFGQRLYTLCSKEEDIKLKQLETWLEPTVSSEHFFVDGIALLCDVIKKNSENVLKFPGQVITALRILKHLCVAKSCKELNVDEQQTELKYKYAIIQLFHNGMVGEFTDILNKLEESYPPSHIHSYDSVGQSGTLLLTLLHPMMCLLKYLLSYAIECRSTDFADLTAVKLLLFVHALMSVFPSSSLLYTFSVEVQQNVIDTLLAYTQPLVDVSQSEEVLTKSLWTKMLHEVIVYSTSTPCAFWSGLQVLTELLPLPLPLNVPEKINKDQIVKIVNSRKLWSAHLHGISGLLSHFIATIGCSSYSPLLQLLRRVCTQLADLAAPTALVIARSLLEAILNTVKQPPHIAGIQLLNFFSSILAIPSIKAAVLQLLRSSNKQDEKLIEIIPLLSTQLNSRSEKISNLSNQMEENIFNIFQALCDCDIVLGGSTPPAVLANGLPTRDQLQQILSAVLNYLTDIKRSFASILLSLRILEIFTDTDYTFYLLIRGLQDNTVAFLVIIEKLLKEFDKDNSDCLSVISTFLAILRLLYIPENPVDPAVPIRTLKLPIGEVAKMINWSAEHPLLEIHKQIIELGGEVESLETLGSNLKRLADLFSDSLDKMEKWDLVEPELVTPEPLSVQFSLRSVFEIEEMGDLNFWLTPPSLEDLDQDGIEISVNLLDITKKYFPDMDLIMEVQKASKMLQTEESSQKSIPLQFSDDRKPNIENKKKVTTTPQKGKSFVRNLLHLGRTDPFRSRPPNTSRPPSMHVDDFVALESTGQQPTGPTGYNPQTKRAIKDGLLRQRGRNIKQFPTERTRHVSTLNNYSRQENSRVLSSNTYNSCRMLTSRSSDTSKLLKVNNHTWKGLNKEKQTCAHVGKQETRHARSFSRL